MKNLAHIQNVYFIGIGGIGMSAIARYFNSIGKNVAGYDKTATALTNELQKSGIQICFSDTVEDIPKSYLDPTNTLVVYTPAVPNKHPQLNYFIAENYEVHKRAKILGLITKDTFTLAVAGTHGKTTTSTILAHLLYESGEKITAFLGGISENYNSNYISSGNEVVVVEADEFDRSFLQLFPNISAITSTDADHLDIYGAHDSLLDSFEAFAKLTTNKLYKTNGLEIKGLSIGINDNADYSAKNVTIKNGSYHFDLQTPDQLIPNLQVNLPGHHNLRNAITAFVMAMEYGTAIDKLKKALRSFKGIQRRFSYQINEKNKVYIDDYAHHPTEIDALHQAVREMHPNQKVLAIFQPHLFSRTQDFGKDFGKSLAQFDELLLLDIYPARELPIPGINSDWLLNLVDLKEKRKITKKDITSHLKNSDATVIVTIGAGDIGAEVPRIKKALLNA